MLNKGFENVYQLDGGILQYLEDTQASESRWNGECFVFDQRVSVNADLEQGQYKQCYACRHPLSVEELASAAFEHVGRCFFATNTAGTEHGHLSVLFRIEVIGDPRRELPKTFGMR